MGTDVRRTTSRGVGSYVGGMEQTNVVTTRSKSLSSGALTVTRVLAGILAILVIVQGALAGSYLTGDGGALDAHRMLGTQVLTILGLAVAITSAVAFRRNRWALPVSVLAFLGLWAQIQMGFLDQLSVHLPLGIALFGTYLTLALALRDRTKEQQT